jgi:hypothetical protein
MRLEKKPTSPLFTYSNLLNERSQFHRSTRQALGGIDGPQRVPKAASKSQKRLREKLFFQVEGKGKMGSDHFRTKRVPRPLAPVAK